MTLCLRGRRVITPEGERPALIEVQDGLISAISDYSAAVPRDVVDVPDDCVLMPGLVDTHVHVNEPGRTEWEGFATATRAAAAGGITTVLDMPLNSIPPTVDVAALEVKRKAADGQCAVDVGFWGGAIGGNVGELAPLYDAGVFGFKCFLLDSGVPEFPPVTDLDPVLAEIARIGAVLLVHAEDGDDLEPHSASPYYGDFLRSRPATAEYDAIARVLDAAARTGARVHIVHLAAATAVPMLAQARADGIKVTVETCPHYLTFAADEVPDGATEFKCCPPIRDADNRDGLWQALADGVIDIVVSDHSPCTPELKGRDTGDFAAAWGGIASVQLSLPAVWTAAEARGHSLSDVVSWMSTRPAAFAGLPSKGRIAVGAEADLVVFAPEEEFTVDAAALAHRNPVTPYHGHRLRGAVRTTYLRGEPAGNGRLLTRAGA